jgi:hypothetical protein
MNPTLTHRINTIEAEMDGEHDLRRVLTQPCRSDLLACARSGQMDSRQIAAHVAAGELRLTESDIGFECALPIKEPAIQYAGREPISGEAKVLIAAVTVTWLTVMALSIQDLPERIVSLWPAIVAFASF